MSTKILLQPNCLKWARLRAHLTTAELAKRMDLIEQRIIEWEENGEIDLHHVDRLAEKTYISLGLLFLPSPITEELPISDFRTVGSDSVKKASPELIDTVNTVLSRQAWYKNYVLSEGAPVLSFVGSLSASGNETIAAQKIRETVSWDTQVRARASSWTDAISRQIEAVEKSGILVMSSGVVGLNNSRQLKVNEFRGFAVSDEYAPIIFLNSNDADAARMFTLAHELVHIFLGASGVSNVAINNTKSSLEVERFCNAVAAELLVPTDELHEQWQLVGNRPNSMSMLRAYFKVSSLVILRRLRDVHHISEAKFKSQFSREIALINKQVKGKAHGTGGPSTYVLLRSRLGKPFSEAISISTLSGETTYRDASSLISLKSVGAVKRFAEQVIQGAM